MARGKSGRIVVEVAPEFKKRLYLALAHESLTLREWFIREAAKYIDRQTQPSLFGSDPVDGDRDSEK